MDYKIVFNVIGKLLILLAASMLLPLIVAIYYKEPESINIFAAASIITALSGAILSLALKSEGEFRRRESFAIVAVGWFIVTIFAAIPYLLYGLHPVDALFESMAGLTTTGSTILTDIEGHTRSFLFWRSLTQWLGGMGIIVLVLAIAPGLGVAGRQLFRAEMPGPESDKLTPHLKATAKILWSVYLLFSIAEMILLYLAGLTVYDAVTTTFSTMATGGFLPHEESIMAFHNPYVEVIIILFMFIAGASFALHYKTLFVTKKSLVKNREFQVYTLILVTASLLVAMHLKSSGLDIVESVRLSTFQVVSVMTTTGFATADFNQWGDFSRIILFFLMFIGGCAGSTGGAIKVVRISLIVKYAYRELFKALHPHVVKPVRFAGKAIPSEIMQSVLAFILLYMFAFVTSTLLLSGLGLDFISSLSASAATLGNIGPGLNLVGPMSNYAAIPAVGKIVLILNMWIGRLEVITVLILFIPEFWKR
ncbi:MAG: TrkH family potassium uptake protein [Methanosarcinales archaeon]|uniref:TrkH family potassium uptake protein n=1 Tax=Candidatus Ethanoperedens thermophilum TaxID=2766897 RepID=A0A848D645_9EURY|nr:TrkH family potassium uptake protein [Candidatus Ethanoperedens thermophilum]